uniref:Uncharacterized protein n=1 Tax=Aegilops tauschii subsp. strangulata TaxID=200361 RepID=A0A453RAT4_AEGTS
MDRTPPRGTSRGCKKCLFIPMEVEVIKSTPSLWRQGDFWACFFDKKGTFTIHSADNMLVSTKTKLGY